MGMIAQNPNQYAYARSDAELEQHLREAVEASNDGFAFRIQFEEVLPLSNCTFAYELQLSEITSQGIYMPSASFPSASNEGNGHFEFDNQFLPQNSSEEQVYSSAGNWKGKGVDSGSESQECSYKMPGSVQVELCGICFEDSLPEIFVGLHCFHRYCRSCMTRYIHSRVDQKRHQIYCPHDTCSEALTPQECAFFLPAEIFEAWSALNLQAQIAESEKVYCPFSDCSALLVMEEAEDILNAECPFCNRMFCTKCMVPWHADLDCSEFQNLPPTERSEVDLQLFKLAENRKWQRCGKCKGMIELTYGCNHMTCRCGYEFCYECGTGWANGRVNCNCPRASENCLLHRT